MHVVETVKFLARQNLPLRGLTVSNSEGDSPEPDGNFNQTLNLLSIYSPKLSELRRRKQDFSSPDVQNELVQLMGNHVANEIAKEIKKASCYSIMIDETSDISNREQAVFCFRYIILHVYARSLWLTITLMAYLTILHHLHVDNYRTVTIVDMFAILYHMRSV